MPITRVSYLPQSVASEIYPTPSQAMISIADYGEEAPLQPGWFHLLRMSFDDAEYDRASLESAHIGWWLASGAIGPEDAIILRSQIERWNLLPFDLHVFVHCHRGESRSGAVAQYIVETYGCAMDQPISPKSNRTVLALLRDPWSIASRAEYMRTNATAWGRAKARIKEFACHLFHGYSNPRNSLHDIRK